MTHLGNGMVELEFRYNAAAIARLKELIPSACRSYDRDSKTWMVSVGMAGLAIEILEFTFGEVTVEHAAGSRPGPTPIRTSDADYRALHLLSSAPGYVIEAAYRAMAKANHPDVGGNVEVMTKINLAFEQLQRRAGAA
ncbi:MAG: hypothetical protein ACR2OO_03380 [Thermomicrobiales bacterium]